MHCPYNGQQFWGIKIVIPILQERKLKLIFSTLPKVSARKYAV